MRHDPYADLEPLVQRLYAYLAYRLGDAAQAERVAASVLERALRNRAAVGRDDPAAFLVGLARRELAAGQLRALDHAGRRAGGEPAPTTRHFDLEPALAELDEADRELIGLRYGADLTFAQIGELLELGADEAASSVRGAIARLRERTFVVV